MWKGLLLCFHKAVFLQTQFLPIMAKFILSWQEHHIHQMNISRAVHRCREMHRGGGETIMFLSSKLCLLIALLLGWLLMDITFHAIPWVGVWSSAFWNERLCNALLKLVQRGFICHPRRCQRGAATLPCLPVAIRLQRELLSASSLCSAMHRARHEADFLHMSQTREPSQLQCSSYFRSCHPAKHLPHRVCLGTKSHTHTQKLL